MNRGPNACCHRDHIRDQRVRQRMIPKSVQRFSEKIMRQQ
jgi:hypothetical protein